MRYQFYRFWGKSKEAMTSKLKSKMTNQLTKIELKEKNVSQSKSLPSRTKKKIAKKNKNANFVLKKKL